MSDDVGKAFEFECECSNVRIHASSDVIDCSLIVDLNVREGSCVIGLL